MISANADVLRSGHALNASIRRQIVASGDVSPAGMKGKLGFVIGVISGRLAERELSWNEATHVDLYLVADAPRLWSGMLPALSDAGNLGSAASLRAPAYH